MSATERLIALLEQRNPSDPGTWETVQALRHSREQLAERLDRYRRLVEAVGAEHAASIVVGNTLHLGGGWLPR